MGTALEGRVALVTGASEGGTGRATAIRFAAEGAKVAITAPNLDGLEETQRLIRAIGSDALILPADFSDPNGARNTLVKRTESTLGPIDILVNNAVTATMKPIEAWTVAELDVLQQVNVWTPWLLMGQVLPGMRERGRGWIVNLTSPAAELPPGPPYGRVVSEGYAAYGATKAALNRITIAAAAETEHDPIAINALAPQAAIATPNVLASGIMTKTVDGEDASFSLEPVETMAEAVLALSTCDPMTITGRIAFSLQLLIELQRPVYDLRGAELLAGVQPDDLVDKVRQVIDFHLAYGGPDVRSLNRPSTPLPASLRS